MTVQCAHCGEELLGSVNRRWRCGHTLVAHTGPADVPPIRRAPISGPLDAPVVAILVDEAEPVRMLTPMRRGSPFSTTVTSGGLSMQERLRDVVHIAAENPYTAVRLAGWISLGLGLMSFIVSFFFPAGAAGIGLAGILIAIWSLVSRKRLVGTLGLILCFIAFVVAIYFLVP